MFEHPFISCILTIILYVFTGFLSYSNYNEFQEVSSNYDMNSVVSCEGTVKDITKTITYVNNKQSHKYKLQIQLEDGEDITIKFGSIKPSVEEGEPITLYTNASKDYWELEPEDVRNRELKLGRYVAGPLVLAILSLFCTVITFCSFREQY